jgi:mono/diheme cytochrome c family protein
MKRYVMLLASAVALSMVPMAAQQGGQKPQPAAAQKADAPPARTGAAIFREYCATCHGVNARGNGPAAAAFKQRPPDLTHLAVRRKGFPRAELEKMILGDDPLQPAHGSREMPIWGPIFRKSPDGATVMKNLMLHLESIQEK